MPYDVPGRRTSVPAVNDDVVVNWDSLEKWVLTRVSDDGKIVVSLLADVLAYRGV